MKQIAFIFFFVCLMSFGFSQGYRTLHVTVKNPANQPIQTKAYLIGFFVNKKRLIDTVSATSAFSFKLSDTLPAGFYNVMLFTDLKDSTGKYQRLNFDVINCKEDIDLTVNITKDPKQEKVKAKAGENFTYNEYFKQKIAFEQKITALQSAILEYPVQDNFYVLLQKQLVKEKISQRSFLENFGKKNPNSVAVKYIRMQQTELANIDIKDPQAKNSPFISQAVWALLNDTTINSLPTAERNKAFIARIDKVLAQLKGEKDVYDLVLDELAKTFEKTGRNDFLVHLNENYILPGLDEHSNAAADLMAKEQVVKKLMIGQPAPEIVMENMGEVQTLADVKARYTLLLFWESDCSHCQELTAELIEFYHQNKSKDFEVVALALDTSKGHWLDYIVSHNFDWLNYCDFKGWQGKAAKDYNVVATPSMFLLDKDKKIIAKPTSVEELKGLVI